MKRLFALLAISYVVLVVLANWLASKYLITVPFTNLTAPAGVLCIGAVLVIRDWIQQLSSIKWASGLILFAGVLSYVTGLVAGYGSLQTVALASLAAFIVSEGIFETLIFTPLRKRNLTGAVALSATIGNFVDSFVFIWLAWSAISFPGATHWGLFEGNFVGKLEMVAVGVALTAARRRVLPVVAA